MELPGGTVTLLFTDIEGSTALLTRLGDRYGEVLAEHRRLLRETWEAHDGVVVDAEGDAFFVAFASARNAVAAAGAATSGLAEHPWPDGAQLRVRIGVHTGEPRIGDGRYWGPDVHYAARVSSAAHGGQTLVSATTAALVGAAGLTSLGAHRLKDFPEPRELFALGNGPHPAPRTLDPLRSNLPSAPSELVGRDAVLTELTDALAGEQRLVTVTGAGGTGKTRLALAVAENLVDRLLDGAFLVPLAEVLQADEVEGRIASALGLSAPALAPSLSGRELLLILDNFEHVLDAAPVVAGILAAAPQVRVLVTSQAPLRLGGEHVRPLEPLAEGDAARLLVERARAAGRREEVDPAALRDLCVELDGSPLAIELAAARLTLLDPGELLDRLRRSPDALGTGGRGLPARHRGLRAALQWTYGLLGPDTQILFRRLGHFTGPATLERIEAVCELGALDELAELVDLSLVRRRRDGRFELPSALRPFARELLEASGEADALLIRHTDAVFADLQPLAYRSFLDRTRIEALCQAEMSDLQALLRWAAEHDRGRMVRLAVLAFPALVQHGWLQDHVEALVSAAGEHPLEGRMAAILALVLAIATRDGRVELDLTSFDYEGDTVFEGSFASVVPAMEIMDDVPGAAGRAEAVVERLSSWPDAEVRALAPALDAFVRYGRREWDAAAAAWQELVSRRGEAWIVQAAVYMIGDCQLFAGDPAAAVTAYAQGLRAALDRGANMDAGFQAEGIAAALVDLGEHAAALTALGASDQFTGPSAHPRDVMPGWAEVVTPRLVAARSALGPAQADAAYARGAGLALSAAVAHLFAEAERLRAGATR